MAVEEFRGFTYTCDRCSKTHQQFNAAGHYSDSIPPDWCHVTYRPAVDMRERLPAVLGFSYLLCDECLDECHLLLRQIRGDG